MAEQSIDPELLSQFTTDAQDMLSRTDELFAQLSENPQNKDAIHELFRITHNIKGNAGYINLDKINKLAHKMEELLLVVREKEGSYNEKIAGILAEGVAKLKIMIGDCAATTASPDIEPDLQAIIDKLMAMSDEVKRGDVTGLWKGLQGDINLFAEKFQYDNPELLELLSRIMFAVAALSPIKAETAEEAVKKEEHREAAQQPAHAADHPEEKEHASHHHKTLRIDETHADRLIALSKKLDAAAKALCANPAANASDAGKELCSLSKELGAESAKLRLVPIKSLLSKAPLMVKDIAKKVNKQARVHVQGGDVLIDKLQLEMLEAPFTHIIRNAVDHGIEAPQARKEKGKEEEGQVSVIVSDQGPCIKISFADDGKGIDTSAVKWKAIQKGMLAPEKASTITETEVYGLLFLPGFSTSDVATDISGRGVGMDVVKTNVESMGGKIEIMSKIDFGTVMTITLPK